MPCVPCRHKAEMKIDANGKGYTEKYSYCDTCEVKMLFNKLKRYEDLEEQGRLVELTCKVGDYVYKIHNNDWKQFLRGGGMKLEIIKSVFTYKDIPCIGTLVFLTKEEAEAKLAEMEGK